MIVRNWLSDTQVSHESLLSPNEIPRRFADVTLGLVTPQALVKVAQRYSDEFWNAAPKGIAPLFLGAAGQYKTVTAACIAKGIRQHYRINVAWCNCAAEFTQLDRDSFSEATRTRLAWLKSAPFLVMDDFAAVPAGGRMMHTMIEVGTTRYDAMLPTLWTGNLVLEKGNHAPLVAAVGAALSRRMLETAKGFAVQVKG